MRRFFLLTSALLFLLTAYGTCQHGQWNRSYHVGTAPQLRVESNDASIKVRNGGRDFIEARIYVDGYNINSGDRAVTIHDQQNGNQLHLNVHIPQSLWSGNLFGKREVRIEITVPEDTFVSASTSDGSITLEGLRAGAELRTSDGSISVSGHQGSLKAHTSDGSIHFEGVFDNLDLHTSDGSIHGTVRRGSHLNSSWHITTSDGSVELGVPGDFAAQLDLGTGDGSVHIDGFQLNGNITHDRVNAALNGGGQRLEIHTSDGSIRLYRD